MIQRNETATERRDRLQRACADALEIRKENLKKRISSLSTKNQGKQRLALIEDLKRVFDHADNPYRGFSASRARYRQLGHFGEVHVFDHFGTHAEFLRAAKLQDSRGTHAHKLAVAHSNTIQTVGRYASDHVLRHVGKWEKKLRDKTGEKIAVVLSDLHSQFLDPFSWRVAREVIKMVEPDLVVLNGDVVDFWAVSRHLKLPGQGSLGLQAEIDFTKLRILNPLRRLCPDAPIVWHIGNHEYRLVRYLADTAPELAELRCLAFDKLFGVDEFEIEMVFGGNFLAPKRSRQRQEVQSTWKRYYDCWAVTHGTSISKNPASDQISRYGMSGTSGHVHRPNLVFVPTLACPTANWMSTGMMAGHAVGKDFVQEPSAWTMGFGIATILPSRGVVIQRPVVIQDGFATFSGHVWFENREEKLKRLASWQ